MKTGWEVGSSSTIPDRYSSQLYFDEPTRVWTLKEVALRSTRERLRDPERSKLKRREEALWASGMKV